MTTYIFNQIICEVNFQIKPNPTQKVSNCYPRNKMAMVANAPFRSNTRI